ncbi:MAG: family 65 glycosyl hydrolase [Actinomycetota bacterium]|nr:family 65 glycosyl hydrolase [Actinomycetota bacterium]
MTSSNEALAGGPWKIVEPELDLDRLGVTESVFALGNGHLGLRGNLDEGEPRDSPGSYLNSVYELRPMPAAEPGYGTPESSQTVLNVTNGKVMRVLVDDEPLDVRYGSLRRHRRELDLRAGVLTREMEWVSPAGQAVRITSRRMVSYTQRSVAAIHLEIEPIDDPARIVVQSELVAGEPQPRPDSADPRVAAVLEHPLRNLDHSCRDGRVVLVHRTERSEIGLAAAMVHDIDGPDGLQVTCDSSADLGRTTVTAVLEAGTCLRIVKYLGYGWSTVRSDHALRDQVTAAIDAARHSGWEQLLAEQRRALDDFWSVADVEIEGDDDLQAAVRCSLFHAFQAGVRAEGRPIAAKGLTGSGYDGHAFWDTEAFVLPFLVHADHRAAAHALRWRHSTLDVARARADALELRGAAFAWRTIGGEECSGYWPAGTAAFHVNAAVARAVTDYVQRTDDRAFERDIGVELLVETARLWASLGHFGHDGEFRIDGVTGPDEYSAVADNNTYTNLMARQNLRAAADACARHPEVADRLDVGDDEPTTWRRAADVMRVPFDHHAGVHQQADGFTEHERWPFDPERPERYPMFRYRPYFDLYRRQILKQADLVLALHLCPEEFDPDQARRDFEYYEPLTVRDSSLSAISQATVAARTGHVGLAECYLAELAFLDLDDVHGNTRDGLHIAAAAGVWTAVVHGFGGVDRSPTLRLRPVMPPGLTRLAFVVRHGPSVVEVTMVDGRTSYRLRSGSVVQLDHHGEQVEVGTSGCTVDTPTPADRPPPGHPPGRRPGGRTDGPPERWWRGE